MSSKLKNNIAENRYELEIDKHIVFADYRLEDKTLYIRYVEAPEPLRGTGAAGKFMHELMQNAKAENYKVVPICGYAASWIRRHKEYKALVA